MVLPFLPKWSIFFNRACLTLCAFLAGLMGSKQGAKALCRDSRRSDLLFITAGVWTVLSLLPWRSKAILLLFFWHRRACGSCLVLDVVCCLCFYTVKVPSFVCLFSIADAIFSFRWQQECVGRLHILSHCFSPILSQLPCLCPWISVYPCFVLKSYCLKCPLTLHVASLPPHPTPHLFPQRPFCSHRW